MKTTKPHFRFLILILFVLTSSVFAQEVDHVYLKNGSVIRGNIMEVEPEDHVKITDLCGNIWYYKIAEVEKITSEPYQSEFNISSEPIEYKPGFVNMTSIGFLAGSASNSQVAPFSLVMVNGWRHSSGLFVGGGIGIEFLSTNYMPLFLDLRYDLFGTDVVPYIVAKGGYSVPLAYDRTEHETEYAYLGGPLLGVGVGLKIKTRTHFAWDIELMYRYQETSYTETYGWNDQVYHYSDIYNRIEIRLGFYID